MVIIPSYAVALGLSVLYVHNFVERAYCANFSSYSTPKQVRLRRHMTLMRLASNTSSTLSLRQNMVITSISGATVTAFMPGRLLGTSRTMEQDRSSFAQLSARAIPTLDSKTEMSVSEEFSDQLAALSDLAQAIAVIKSRMVPTK